MESKNRWGDALGQIVLVALAALFISLAVWLLVWVWHSTVSMF